MNMYMNPKSLMRLLSLMHLSGTGLLGLPVHFKAAVHTEIIPTGQSLSVQLMFTYFTFQNSDRQSIKSV